MRCLHRQRCAAGEACEVLVYYIETGRTRGSRVPSRELFASLFGRETYSKPMPPPAPERIVPAAASLPTLQHVERGRPRDAAGQADAAAWEADRRERAQQKQEARAATAAREAKAAAREAEARRARALAERLVMSADEARAIRATFRFPRMTLTDLASVVGVSTAAVSDWERGLRPVPPEAVATLIAFRDGLWKYKGSAKGSPRIPSARGRAFIRAALQE